MPAPPKSFDEPVAASRARSRAQEIVNQNRDEVERAIGDRSRRDLIRILLGAQKQIAEAQRTTNPDAKWTHLDLEQTMRIVADALGATGTTSKAFRELLEKQREQAYAVGAKSTAEMLSNFEGGKDTGTVRPLAIREALAMKRMALDEHATSVDRYGKYMIQAIRRDLQGGIVRGATFEEMTDLLVGKKGPKRKVSLAATELPDGKVKRLVEVRSKEGLFVERRGWAERIVRTEGMRAYAAGADEEIVRQKANAFPDLVRKLVETFDSRTAPDSYVAHGQVRDANEPFFDGKHTYLRPPGRPNDRATLIPWRSVWAGKDGKGGTDEEGELTAEELGVLNAAPAKAAQRGDTKADRARGHYEPSHDDGPRGPMSALTKTEEAEVRSAPSKAGLDGFLRRNPVPGGIRLVPMIMDGGRPSNGHTDPVTGIRVSENRDDFGLRLGKGDVPSASMLARSRVEAVQYSLMHEMGHHVHDVARQKLGPDVDARIRAYRDFGTPVTKMGRMGTSGAQYFAECFALHAMDPASLKKLDPVGFDMIEAIRRELGIDR